MPSPGLTLTQQPRLSTATITADAPASIVWQRLADAGLREEVEKAVRSLVGDLRPGRRALALEEHGVSAMEGLFASAVAGLADADPIREERQAQARRLIGEFGAAERSAVGLHAPLDELADGPLAVLDTADRTPTVTVELDGGFDDLRADQREDVVGLLADLAAACDVRVVCGRATAARVRQRYHERLPVSAPCNARPSDGEVTARVETARAALGPDGRELSILRTIATEASETASYHALSADAQVSDSRVRQCIGTLVNLDLVAAFDGPAGRMVELLAAGRHLLETLKTEIGVQQSIEECVSDPPNDSDENVYTPEPQSRETAPPTGGAGGGAERGGWTDARYLSRPDHAAVAGAAEGVDIALSEHPIEGADQSPLFSYRADHNEVVAGAEFHSPLQWLVSTARSLAGPKMWEHVLPPERLNADADLGALPDPEVWTRCSQGGWCSKDERTAADYIERLLGAREAILEWTTEYRNQRDAGEDADADETARRIVQHSHGLIGTVTRMLDYCDVDLVRYLQLPEYAADWHTSENHRRRRSILKTIAKTSAIAGAYGAYTAERTLYEPRTDKREFSLGAPQVTTEESGEFIGSWTIAGRGVTKLLDPADGPGLESALRSPGELQEDGTNFAAFDVPLSIGTDRDTDATRAVVRRMCGHKNTRPTEIAVRLFATCTGSVFDAARALNHLGAEPADMPRPIRLDEVRRALATAPADRLLADAPSRSAGSLLKTMLNTTETLNQAELANRAGVSTQTVRNTADILEALALVERTEGGPGEPVEWRCSLPTRDERGERGSAALDPDRRADGPAIGGFARTVEDLTEALAPPDVIADHGSEIRDLNTLRERCPALTPWLRLAAILSGTEFPPGEYDALHPGECHTTSYGEAPLQTGLASAQRGVAD